MVTVRTQKLWTCLPGKPRWIAGRQQTSEKVVSRGFLFMYLLIYWLLRGCSASSSRLSKRPSSPSPLATSDRSSSHRVIAAGGGGSVSTPTTSDSSPPQPQHKSHVTAGAPSHSSTMEPVTSSHGQTRALACPWKSWNNFSTFSRPGKSLKTDMVLDLKVL